MPTVVQKTIKASGGDYTSLFNLEAANANLVALDQAWEVTCDNIADATAVAFNGWTTSATCYLKIKSVIPHGSVGRITTNSYRLVVNTAGTVMSVNGIGAGGLIIFEGLQFQCTHASGTLIDHSNNGVVTAKVRYQNCVFVGTTFAMRMSGGATATNDVEIINCTMLSVNWCIYREYHSLWVYGSTIISTGAGNTAVSLGANDGSARVMKNCYVRGATTAITSLVGATLTKVLTSDTTGDVDSIAYTTANFTNVTAASENFTPVGGSALLVAGMDRSAEVAPFNYTTDIAGLTRPIVGDDVGPFQVTAVAGGGGGVAAFALGVW